MTDDRTDNERAMTLAEFAALLDRFGAAPPRWPAEARPRAEALLRVSAEARALQAEEAAFDRLLDLSEVPPPPPSLRDAVLAASPGQRARRGGPGSVWTELLAVFGGWRPAAAALAASLVLGVASGGVLFGTAGDELGPELAQLALFDNTFTGY